MPQGGERGGRIVPPARDTDDSTPIRVTNLRPEDRDAIFHNTDDPTSIQETNFRPEDRVRPSFTQRTKCFAVGKWSRVVVEKRGRKMIERDN
jgi:hypothetical protein